jgi:hypothetical protein
VRRVAAGIICYQDRLGLQRAINSCYEHIDKFIVIDGRYVDWGAKTDPEFSTDGTEEYCKSLDKVDYYQMFTTQTEKRTKYLQETKKHDCEFLLVLDADDYAHKETDWDQFHNFVNLDNGHFEYYHDKPCKLDTDLTLAATPKSKFPCQIHAVQFKISPNDIQWIGRLFFKPYELHYISHWKVKRGDMRTHYPKQDSFRVPGLVMASDDMTRPKSRLNQDIDYQWDLFYREGSIEAREYLDPISKERFAKAINTEYIVWEEYYKEKGLEIYDDN